MTLKNVENMTSSRGNKIANQFIITTDEGQYFKSYDSIIAFKPNDPMQPIKLDCIKWDYSTTTSKYRNLFLNCETKDIKQMTKDGDLIFINLNYKTMKNITLLKKEKYNYTFEPSELIVNGTAVINLWGGGQEGIGMESFSLSLSDIKDEKDLLKQIKENANDGKFGCESIERIEDIHIDVLSKSDSMTLVTDTIFFDTIEI